MNPPQLQSFERIQNSRTHSGQPQLSCLFWLFLSYLLHKRRDSNQICQCLHSRWELQPPSPRAEQGTHLPHTSLSAPFLALPRGCSSSEPGEQCFSPLSAAQRAFPARSSPAAGSVPGCHSLNPFCCSTGSCQSSLCPRPRLPPPSSSVYTPCWICSACHLQRHCLGPAKTPQIQLALVPPPCQHPGTKRFVPTQQPVRVQLTNPAVCSQPLPQVGYASNGKRPFSASVEFSSTLKQKERPTQFKGWLHRLD